MAMSDSIADLLTRIRNASSAGHRFVEAHTSKMRLSLVELLKSQGFVEGFITKEEGKGRGMMRIYLKYSGRKRPVIHGLRRVSRPGRRLYVGHKEIPHVLGGMGVAVLSTPQGLLSGDDARQQKVGGELLCFVW